MSKYNVRINSYFKEQIMDRGENISSACDKLISEIPNEIINKLLAMSFDDAKIYVNYVYANFNSTQDFSTNTELSVRLKIDLDIIIDKCSTEWGEKANKSEVIKILLAVGIMYQDYKCYVLKESKPFSFRMLYSIKIPPSIKKTLSIEMPLSIDVPSSIEIPPSIDIPLSIEIPLSIKMPSSIDVQSSIEMPLSIKMPPSIEISPSIKMPPSIDVPSSIEMPLLIDISPTAKTSFPQVCYQHGNKNNSNMKSEITKILKQIPNDIQTVVEPFMGMCALTINVLDTLSDRTLDYYVNDKDNNLFKLYKCIYNNYNKLLLSCERLINRLKTKQDDFAAVKNRHLNNNYNNNYDASADYMYLDAVSLRHKKQNLRKNKDKKYINLDTQIECFEKYIVNIRAMHNYLIKTNISHKDVFEMLKKFKNKKKILYLLDPPYILTLGYISKTNGVYVFTYDNHTKLTSLCKNIPPDSIFLLFCRFTETRSLKKGETNEDIKNKEKNGDYEIDDRILRGFYKREFGVETEGTEHKFFYKEIYFDSKGTIEAIISNVQFDGFKPF